MRSKVKKPGVGRMTATAVAMRAVHRGSSPSPYIAARQNSLRAIIGKANVGKKRKITSANRAKILTDEQLEEVLDHVSCGEYPERDAVLVLLGFGAGLRAQEMAGLQWKRNVLAADGSVDDEIFVSADIGKNTVAREIPMNGMLRQALTKLRTLRPYDPYIIYPLKRPSRTSQRAKMLDRGQCDSNTIVQYLRRLYMDAGLLGCTSHSARRTFITNAARRCNQVGASIRDVQQLAGHRSLETTAMYIEASEHQRKLISLVL